MTNILTKEQIEAIERRYQHLSDGKSHEICLALASHEALRRKVEYLERMPVGTVKVFDIETMYAVEDRAKQQEREECAKVAGEYHFKCTNELKDCPAAWIEATAKAIARAIRERK
jgi:hypothetical protein